MAQRYLQLFQYGSNMDPERLNSAERLGDAAQEIGVGRLDGWGIRFELYSKNNRCGVTNIVPSKREHVLGILYEVPYRLVIAPRGQRSQMDKIEGARCGRKSNYKRQKVIVKRKGEALEARTYVGTAAGRKRFLRRSREDRQVAKAYFNHLLAGARKSNFPQSYVAYLRRQAGALK